MPHSGWDRSKEYSFVMLFSPFLPGEPVWVVFRASKVGWIISMRLALWSFSIWQTRALWYCQLVAWLCYIVRRGHEIAGILETSLAYLYSA